MMNRIAILAFGLCLLLTTLSARAADLASEFVKPPDSARPWVYWFWLNGNITRQGITADLEAMKRVGIGGVLIMEVDQGAPLWRVPFMGQQWRELFKHVVAEAQRLGLEVNMNNDAGWNGSGGPWIKPEQSMQEVTWSELEVAGPKRFEGTLAQPRTVAGYYRDIAVLAFPSAGDYRLPNFEGKAAFQHRAQRKPAAQAALKTIDRARVVNLTAKMDKSGRLVWDVPEGEWTILRVGHTCTGAENAPAPASGRGLECDKLSREGIEANFAGMMAKLAEDNGPAMGKALVATHIDSWENGSQNWTAKMREEFQRRRGYDMEPYLPVMTGRVVGSAEISERFLWDLRRTVSELVIENYAGRMRELAHEHGMKYTCEAYGSPCDYLPYGGQADEPMGEFWMGGGAIETCRGMASAGHAYGKRIIGAEAFTAADQERWKDYPASIKSLGDRAFCEGINRFVFHRYAMQPWTEHRVPGMTMGPWGLHYERTETWWEWSKPWHEYLARCQQMLRQGLFVADICYLQAEASPHGFGMHRREGYDWDECSADVVMNRMRVENGRIVLPDGMSYRVLVLPDSQTMTPTLLAKINELVEAGATIIGRAPIKSPSLGDYPRCDQQVKQLAAALWGDAPSPAGERKVGRGRVIWGRTAEQVLGKDGVAPDFATSAGTSLALRFIHRATSDADIYFVANGRPYATTVSGAFRVSGRVPELWWPDSGRIEHASMYEEKNGVTRVLLPLGPSGSVFVVFREKAVGDPIVSVARQNEPVLSLQSMRPPLKIIVTKATYGVLGDPKRTRDVRAKAQRIIDAGETGFQVARMAEGDDPAYMVVKTLILEYTIDGKPATIRGTDPETVDLATAAPDAARPVEIHRDADGRLAVLAWQPGKYELKLASGKTLPVEAPAQLAPAEVGGPWQLAFPPNQGAPAKVTLDKLISWSEHTDPGVKYFSGTATYTRSLNVPAEMLGKDRRLYLDLGDVRVMARVKLNGTDMGILWKPPYRADITAAARPGENALEVQVVNLWPNRMVGDEQLPEDSDRNPNGTLKKWPDWLEQGKPSPTGRFTFTSWRLWKKDSPLLESGLLGPVMLRPAAVLMAD